MQELNNSRLLVANLEMKNIVFGILLMLMLDLVFVLIFRTAIISTLLIFC